MLKRLLDRIRHTSWLAGLAVFATLPQGAQPPADSTQNTVAIIIVIAAFALPIVLGGGFALVTWLISLGTPTPLVGSGQNKVVKREVLPDGVHLPPPSSRPIVLSLGVTIIFVGLLFRNIAISLSPDFNVPIIMVLGLIIMLVGLIGWIRDDVKVMGGH